MNIERISYLIVDDGDGTESLKNIFDFGLNKNTRFHSIYELKIKMVFIIMELFTFKCWIIGYLL